jgi:NADH-quinone oxidoreductase subunit E
MSCWSTYVSEARIQPGETTSDGKLTLEHAECLGACELAPCVLANDELLSCVTTEAADEFLKSLQ